MPDFNDALNSLKNSASGVTDKIASETKNLSENAKDSIDKVANKAQELLKHDDKSE